MRGEEGLIGFEVFYCSSLGTRERKALFNAAHGQERPPINGLLLRPSLGVSRLSCLLFQNISCTICSCGERKRNKTKTTLLDDHITYQHHRLVPLHCLPPFKIYTSSSTSMIPQLNLHRNPILRSRYHLQIPYALPPCPSIL